jgi:uracil phosphoribosyltransferase
MLATGQSIVAVYNKLMERHAKEIHIAVVIAAQNCYLKQHLPEHCHLWVASLDDKLNEHSYIVPGRLTTRAI